jgi:AcrR family transcriptional regulator
MARTLEFPAPGRGAYDRSLSRAERDAQHRERLLRATAEILLESELTMARVIERAGVGRSTFYEFFDSPEHAVTHLQQRALRSLQQALEAAFSAAHTPLERLRAIARAWLRELDARQLDARVMLAHRVHRDALSPAGATLLAVLQRVAPATPQPGAASLNGADDASLLATAAAVEAVSRRHLADQPMRDGVRTLTELMVKLLR